MTTQRPAIVQDKSSDILTKNPQQQEQEDQYYNLIASYKLTRANYRLHKETAKRYQKDLKNMELELVNLSAKLGKTENLKFVLDNSTSTL